MEDVITALNRRASASQARSRAAEADCGKNPLKHVGYIRKLALCPDWSWERFWVVRLPQKGH